MSVLKGIKAKSKLAGALLVAVVILLIVISLLRTRKIDTVPGVPTASPADLSDHPIYSKYPFGQTDNVIDMGMQPLGLTSSIISEAMKRDAVLKSALSEQGLEIRFHPFLKGADINFFLKRGDLDVAIAGNMPTLAAAADSDVIVVARNRLGFNSIVTKRHMLIKDLKGKRVGYAFGSSAHHNILHALSSSGLREEDVHLIDLDVNKMPDALAEGKIDAFAAWEPTPTIALSRFSDFVVIHRSLVSTYLYFSRSFVDRHPEAARHIMSSQLRSISWMKRRKDNLLRACGWTLQSIDDFTGQEQMLSADQYASLIRSDLLDITSISFIPEHNLEAGGRLFVAFKFLKALSKISPSGDWDSVCGSFDSTIINEVVADPEKYGLNEYRYDIDGGSDE